MLPELTQKMVSQGFPMENQNNIVNEPIIYYPMHWPGTKQCPEKGSSAICIFEMETEFTSLI